MHVGESVAGWARTYANSHSRSSRQNSPALASKTACATWVWWRLASGTWFWTCIHDMSNRLHIQENITSICAIVFAHFLENLNVLKVLTIFFYSHGSTNSRTPKYELPWGLVLQTRSPKLNSNAQPEVHCTNYPPKGLSFVFIFRRIQKYRTKEINKERKDITSKRTIDSFQGRLVFLGRSRTPGQPLDRSWTPWTAIGQVWTCMDSDFLSTCSRFRAKAFQFCKTSLQRSWHKAKTNPDNTSITSRDPNLGELRISWGNWKYIPDVKSLEPTC